MVKTFTRLGLATGVVFLTQAIGLSTAYAVPTDHEAWSNLEEKIKVFKDAVDPDLYWFIPKIRFEANNGKTVLRPKTLANGKTEYSVRIIPYFSKDLRELVAQNISNIRQMSQLKPVVAKNIGISLPDFNYKFTSPSVTDYQYLDVPRLIRFQLDKDESATFDQLYQDELGVTVEFTISYDGVMTDKYYNIDVSCKEMDRELSTNFKPSVSVSAPVHAVKAYAGADLELAFLNSVQNSVNGVNIVSKGDIPGMQEMLRRVMNLCFVPIDSYGSTYGSGTYGDPSYPTYPSRTTTEGTGTYPTYPSRTTGRGDVIDDGFTPRNQLVGGATFTRSAKEVKLATQEARLMKSLHDSLDLDQMPQVPQGGDAPGGDTSGGTPPPTSDPGLLPSAQLKMGYVFKKTALNKDNQAVVKQVSQKDTTSTTVILESLSANTKSVEKVQVQPLAEKKFTVGAKNSAANPFSTGIKINDGEQYTINAEFTFNAVSSYSPWKSKQFSWDATWAKPDSDLYYRLGTGDWAPVNRRTIITSDVTRGGGELQFYVDRSAIYNKIDEKLRKGNFLFGPTFTIDGIAPKFTVQVSGRRIQVK